MGKKNIPGALVDAETYINGSNNLAGISEAELPKVEFATVTSEQFGLTAEIETPLMGHLKKMDFKLKRYIKYAPPFYYIFSSLQNSNGLFLLLNLIYIFKGSPHNFHCF